MKSLNQKRKDVIQKLRGELYRLSVSKKVEHEQDVEYGECVCDKCLEDQVTYGDIF